MALWHVPRQVGVVEAEHEEPAGIVDFLRTADEGQEIVVVGDPERVFDLAVDRHVLAYYKQNFTQFADTKKVGNLNGAASVQHVADYHAWLPSLDAHYLIQPYWSVYAHYGRGQNIPPTSVFDVTGAAAALPSPTLSDTYQAGSVWKSRRATLDLDAYRIKLENDYSGTFDPNLGEVVYYAGGTTISQGIEAESTVMLGGELAVYLNGTAGTAKYSDTDQWVQNAPKNAGTIGLTYNRGSWNVGLFNKRVGQMFDDNGSVHEAIVIAPFNITNLFLNYTLGGSSHLSRSRIRLAVNNPDRQPRHHRRLAGVAVGPLAQRRADDHVGSQCVGVLHGRLLTPAVMQVVGRDRSSVGLRSIVGRRSHGDSSEHASARPASRTTHADTPTRTTS